MEYTGFPRWQIHSIINASWALMIEALPETTNKEHTTSSVLATDSMLFLFQIILTDCFPSQMSTLTRNL